MTVAPPLKVLLLAENPYMGGIASHVLTLLDAFRGDPEIALVPAALPGLHSDATLVENAEAAGHRVHVFPMTHRFDLRVLGRLRRFVRDEGIGLVHVHGYRGAVMTALARLPVPVVATCHGELVAPNLKLRLWEWLSLRAMRRCPQVVACADMVRDWLIAKGLPADRVVVIPNAALPPAATDDEDVRQRMGIPPERLLVLFAGRLVEGKGVDVLLDALEMLPEAAAVIAGDGPLDAALRRQSAALGDRVWFAGRRTAMGDFFEAADVVALPSRQEALPMTLIEAAAWGKPVVATRTGGIPEVVEDGETGLLAPYGDSKALRDALARLLDPELRQRLGENARTRWKSRFSPPVQAAALREVYRQAAAH